MNTKTKGDIGVGQAIGYYTINSIEVLLPLGDKKPYDLVIDKDSKLQKVQVKYTSHKSKYNVFKCELRVKGGNKTGHTTYKYQEGDFDILFVCTSKGDLYEIPYEALGGKAKINLGKKYLQYKKT